MTPTITLIVVNLTYKQKLKDVEQLTENQNENEILDFDLHLIDVMKKRYTNIIEWEIEVFKQYNCMMFKYVYKAGVQKASRKRNTRFQSAFNNIRNIISNK